MAKVILNSIGIAERTIVRNILSKLTEITPIIAYRVKRLRNKFRLTPLHTELDVLAEREKDKLVEQGFEREKLQGYAPTWDNLLEAGRWQPEPDADVCYGTEVEADQADIEWLKEQLDATSVWVKSRDGEALQIESAMIEAIANLYQSIEAALTKEE